jgi:hypothetical protein
VFYRRFRVTINLNAPSLKSWKTTLGGIVSLFIAAMATYHDASWQTALHDPQVQMAVVVGVIAMFTKDSNVTGGTSGQPSTPTALAAANQAPSPVNPPVAEAPAPKP